METSIESILKVAGLCEVVMRFIGHSFIRTCTGEVSFTDPPVLTWHRPIYFSYLAVVSGTLPQHKGQRSNLLGASLNT